ncbi:hypothetical protein FEDK69T_20470 [Flavobacterium enshiense DK69]|nr:hypothetical protein FEDK69T_20470 [Flavobacterium enshiense DK69]
MNVFYNKFVIGSCFSKKVFGIQEWAHLSILSFSTLTQSNQ